MATIAWIVAIERYGANAGPEARSLDIGTPVGVRAFELAASIAERDPAARIVLSLSLPDTEAYRRLHAELPVGAHVTKATQEALQDCVQQLRGEGTLLVYWVGHGIMFDDRRLLLCANSKDVESIYAVDVDSMLKHLRSAAFPRTQIGFFDACAQTFPQPNIARFGDAVDRDTDQYFYFAASATQVASANTEVPGFSSTVVAAVVDPGFDFPPAPGPLFARLRETFDRMALSTRAFPLQWTEASGDQWSRQGGAPDAELTLYVLAARRTQGEFEHLWRAARHCTTAQDLSDALRTGSMDPFLARLRAAAAEPVQVDLLADAWWRLSLAESLEDACLRLGLSWQDWVACYQQIDALDNLPGTAPPDRLMDLLLQVLGQTRRERGIDSCIRLLTLATRARGRGGDARSHAVADLLRTLPATKSRYDAAIALLPAAAGPAFLLIALRFEARTPAVSEAWIYLHDKLDRQWDIAPSASPLVDQLNELVNRAQELYPDRQLVIELLAPNDLLCSPRALFELVNDELGTCSWLEEDNIVTLRWMDRMKGRADYQPGRWHQKAAQPLHIEDAPIDCTWFDDANTHRLYGLPFAGPSPEQPSRNRPQFFKALMSGAPYMCWPREEPVDPVAFKKVVGDFLSRQAMPPTAGSPRVVGIADALRKARIEGVPGLRELWLFIDEPFRNPYTKKYSDPGAQGPMQGPT